MLEGNGHVVSKVGNQELQYCLEDSVTHVDGRGVEFRLELRCPRFSLSLHIQLRFTSTVVSLNDSRHVGVVSLSVRGAH